MAGDESPTNRPRLLGACLVHALHDGYTDLLYVLLPVWQTQFGLGDAGLAMARCRYCGTMGCLQVPADRLLAGPDPHGLVGVDASRGSGLSWSWRWPADSRGSAPG